MIRNTLIATATSVLLVAPRLAVAQSGVVVSVRDSISGGPLPGSLVSAARARRQQFTDRLGRARFSGLVLPETLLVASIGFAPETLVASAPSELRVAMRPVPVSLAEVRVAAEGRDALALTASGDWSLSPGVMRNAPPAIEADPLRALAVVPAVTFSSPLSARPVIRGYDAADGAIRLDGFELLNPYHLGRFLSGFSADATQRIAVSSAPYRPSDGGSLTGLVDLEGRAGADAADRRGGADLSPVSLSAWFGHSGSLQAFVTGRAAWLGAITSITGNHVPYSFQDGYARLRFGLGGSRSVDGTLFLSHDGLGEPARGLSMRWNNALLGQRWRLVDGARTSLDLVTSANHFDLAGSSLPVRNSVIDVANAFTRFGAGLVLASRLGAVDLESGLSVAHRRMTTTITPRSGDDFPATDSRARLTELQVFGNAHWHAGPLLLDAGARVDVSPTASVVQPRVRVAVALGGHVGAALLATRASRLYQQLTDFEPQLAVAFFDLWLNVGEPGVPVPVVDHVAFDLDRSGRLWSFHGAAFLSRGRGLGELRPIEDQRAGVPALRFGDSRTTGLELRAAWHPVNARMSGALTWVLSSSDRRWDDGVWRPWRLDRRHLLRAQLQAPLGAHWTVFGTGELLSGAPLTPVSQVVQRSLPPTPGDSVGRPDPIVRYRYAAEGHSRSGGTFHADAGVRLSLRGPGHSSWQLGFSVVNLTSGYVAPDEPVDPSELRRPDGSYPPGGVPYRRAFRLPAVPTLNIRIEF